VIEIPVERRGNVEVHRRIADAAIAAVERAVNPTKEEAR
jgi:hypothetical protein